MAYRYRTYEEIVHAFETWLEKICPEPDKVVVFKGPRTYTARQFVQALRRGDNVDDELAINAITIILRTAQERGQDPIELIIGQ